MESAGEEKRKPEGSRETWRERSQIEDCGHKEKRREKPERTGLSVSSELGDVAEDPNQESRDTCPPTISPTPIPTEKQKAGWPELLLSSILGCPLR